MVENPEATDLSPEMLRHLRRVSLEADQLIDLCVRDRLSLRAFLHRFLPALEGWIGAKGALLTTRNEHLVEETFTWGAWQLLGGADLHEEEGRATRVGNGTALWMRIRLAGQDVGRFAVMLEGDRTTAADEAWLRRSLESITCELDVVLATIHVAGHKQRMIVEVEEVLTDPVFDRGVDRAVAALHREIGVCDFVLVFRDEVEHGRLRYRTYKEGVLSHTSEGNRHITLDAAIAELGERLLQPETRLLKLVTGTTHGFESLLTSGLTRTHWLGKVVCAAGDHGFSAFALDVVQVMCEAMSQRLVDLNRERRHLAQFFSPRVIGELLADGDYQLRYLSPREETIAILFADINSFTKISEQVLERPARIAEFVNVWSAGAVDRLYDHGGVFDKMVGDCVIGLFGPPFFRDTPADRARAAMAAAREISAFTTALEKSPPWDAIPRSGVVPGLGVAVGLNLCPTAVGLMGPNQDYTGFSSGMNATARLQSLAGFRETLGMEAFCEALQGVPGVTLGDLVETPVKNVKLPLRYRKITFAQS